MTATVVLLAAATSPPAIEADIVPAIGRAPTLQDNDGVVPLLSQMWGTLVWVGLGDHLDVLGHYRGAAEGPDEALLHRDWLTSGSGFTDAQFAALIDAIARGMLAA